MSENNGEKILQNALREIDSTGEMINAALESNYKLKKDEDDILLVLDQEKGEFTYSVVTTKVRDLEDGNFDVVIARELAHGTLKDFLKNYKDVLLAALGTKEGET